MERRMFIAMAAGLAGVRFVGSASLAGASVKVGPDARGSRRDVMQGGSAERVFTLEEVKSLNEFQRSGVAHPYTCVHGRDPTHLDGEGVLVATERGWICLYC